MISFLVQFIVLAFRTFEKVNRMDGNYVHFLCIFFFNFCLHKHTRRELPHYTRGLEKSVQSCQNPGRDNSLQRPYTEVRNSQRLFDTESQFSQPDANGLWMKVEIQFYEFHWLQSGMDPNFAAKPYRKMDLSLVVSQLKDKDALAPKRP